MKGVVEVTKKIVGRGYTSQERVVDTTKCRPATRCWHRGVGNSDRVEREGNTVEGGVCYDFSYLFFVILSYDIRLP